MLQAVGVSTEKLHFVLGISFQKGPKYIMDVYKLCSLVSEHDAKKAGAEILICISLSCCCLVTYITLACSSAQQFSPRAHWG